MIVLVADHLWQSTLIAAVAGLLALVLRRNRAHVRYCVWLAASVNRAF
jgi:bla regulator protein blaR1